jgi:hypothetical protein
MNVLGILFGSALLATGTAGWVVNTRVNGNVFADLRDRMRSDEEGAGTDWAGRPEAADEEAGEEGTDFSYAGKVDYKPGAKRRLLALGGLLLTVVVVGAIVAGLIALVVYLVNAGITGYVNSG